MPLLGGNTSPFDEIIEKATNEVNTSENWSLIMDICDKISQGGGKGARDGLLSIKKRLNHRDPHVVMHTLSVLDSCWSNCGSTFRREVCSREFIGELRSKATGSNHKVGEKTRLLIKKWCAEEAKNDPSLGLIPSLYTELKKDDYSFEPSDPPKKSVKIPTDPNYVSSKEEEEAIAKAIQLSLSDKKAEGGGGKGTVPVQSLYPSALSSQPPQSRSVKALYDFEAAEDNELTFKAGEIIKIVDDSDINWWRGINHRGEGLFPASFVTADLTSPVENLDSGSQAQSGESKSVKFDENVAVKEEEAGEVEPVRIDEEKLALCLQLLEDADPTGERPDDPQLKSVEEECMGMGPLIDAELADVDRQHNLLAEVDVKLRDALALYDQAMGEASAFYQAQLEQAMGGRAGQGGMQQVPQYQASAAYPPASQHSYHHQQINHPGMSNVEQASMGPNDQRQSCEQPGNPSYPIHNTSQPQPYPSHQLPPANTMYQGGMVSSQGFESYGVQPSYAQYQS